MGGKQSLHNSQMAAQHRQRQLLNNPMLLNEYQKQLLRQAWSQMVRSGSTTVWNMVYRRCISHNPELRTVFAQMGALEKVFRYRGAPQSQNSQGQAQAQSPTASSAPHHEMFADFVNQCLEKLDDLDALSELCVECGARHAAGSIYGFRAEHWDVFGAALTESAREWEGWRTHRETQKAWTVFVSFVVDRIRQGFDDSVRRQRKEDNIRESFTAQKQYSSSTSQHSFDNEWKNSDKRNQDRQNSSNGQQAHQKLEQRVSDKSHSNRDEDAS